MIKSTSDLEGAFSALIFLFVVVAAFPLWLLLGDRLLQPLIERLFRLKRRDSKPPSE